jgi:hypothetical protein
MARQPIHDLPHNYREVLHFTISEPLVLFWVNVAALIPLYIAFAGISSWLVWVRSLRGALDWGNTSLDGVVIICAVFGVLILHEWLHGLAIAWFGYKARYGVKFATLGFLKIPTAFYATTDDGLFRRNDFIVVALAPLVVITLLCMILGFILPDRWHLYLALSVALNAGGAIGDMWMTWIALHYPPSALVRDEADGIRVFVANQ